MYYLCNLMSLSSFLDKATYEIIFGIGIPTEGLTVESITSGIVCKIRYRLPAMKSQGKLPFNGRAGTPTQRQEEWRWSFYSLMEQWANK